MKARRVKGLDPAASRSPTTPSGSSAPASTSCTRFTPQGARTRKQVKALHDMRIAAKRLRYVLEVTAFCFGPYAGTALQRAKELQDLLGEIHDCDEMLPLVRAAVRELRDADVDGLVELAADEDDLAPALGAAVAHADAYGGLEVLAVWLEARRMLLFERFLDRWKRPRAQRLPRAARTRAGRAAGTR